jgi:hypothetical protein
MKTDYFIPALFIILIYSCNHKPANNDYSINSVNFTSVRLTDSLWKPRIDTNRVVTIPYGFKMCKETGRIDNFDIAGGKKKGSFCTKYPFDDSDVYKIIEGASYSLSTNYDAKLDRYIDSLIEKIAAAQEHDGYLETWRTIDPNKPLADWWGSAERWSNLQYGHELYNLGHLYEAAVAHYNATGKKNLLNIALKSANLVNEVFGPGKKIGVPGHEEIEIGLMKLYRITNNDKYLDLARFFINERGDSVNRKNYGDYSQDHLPVRDQHAAVGHAVRAGYLYSAITELSALTGDTSFLPALNDIWNDIVSHKLYITGGVGAKGDGEAFGKPYELPNSTAYSETCAAISMILWNDRMFRISGNSRYFDFLEQTLYNAFLSGVSLSGNKFFYPNPLESDGISGFNYGSATRQSWFTCACCPSNIARFIPQIPGFVYAVAGNIIYVNLFISNDAVIPYGKKKIQLRMTSGYPWVGDTKIKIDLPEKTEMIFAIRIPGWVNHRFLNDSLYYFPDYKKGKFTILVNGNSAEYKLVSGYAMITRQWVKGDSIQIEFPMTSEFVKSNENISDNKNKDAVIRGPIVYCAEGIDNQDNLKKIFLNRSWNLTNEIHSEMGVSYVRIYANQEKGHQIIFIPYALWSNRGASPMKVWIDEQSL